VEIWSVVEVDGRSQLSSGVRHWPAMERLDMVESRGSSKHCRYGRYYFEVLDDKDDKEDNIQ